MSSTDAESASVNAFTEGILSSRGPSAHRHASLSAESLELLGKTAANAYLTQGIRLNTSIAKQAAAHPDISNAQVQRICEFANTAVYLAQHDKNKLAGAGSSYPQFELADAARVIQDISSGSRPTVVTRTDIEYDLQPKGGRSKTASARQRDDQLVELLFATNPGDGEQFNQGRWEGRGDVAVALRKEVDPEDKNHWNIEGTLGEVRRLRAEVERQKTAQETSLDTAATIVLTAKHKLAGMRDVLRNAHGEFRGLKEEAETEFYGLSKEHLLSGQSFTDILAAAQATGDESTKIASAMQPFIDRLLGEQVTTAAKLTAGVRGLEKVAHRRVDAEHPLVQSFASVLHANGEMAAIDLVLQEIDAGMENLNQFIRDNLVSPGR
jgi:hypothetical protein